MPEEIIKKGVNACIECPEDTVWGIGLKKSDPRALGRSTWLGTNWLGEVLTKVRDDIIEEEEMNG